MKILCVVRNYAPHAGEMKAAVPEEPTFFMKPDSALNPKQLPLFYPDFTQDLQHEAEVVVRIERLGKCIQPRFAHKYYHSVALGIDFTARDLQRKAKASGLPWLVSKGFDGSAVVGPFFELEELGCRIDELDFSLSRNGETVQHGNTRDMIFPVDSLIAHISRFMTLRTGDLIFTGTPAGVGPVAIGDTLQGTLCGRAALSLAIK
ncbi:MAG: fumarylacetoacetate hydrolase family protein [Bacteroidales bacterium]|nr:fumarylacetoacetate hydrolase family protein [Bacteroidales bacterium]